MRSMKKELKIFRGTYEEVMAQPTEDMTIYLSWDSQEIFVGNKYGVKTPYIGGQKLTERELRQLFKDLSDIELANLRGQIVSLSIRSEENRDNIETLLVDVETLKGENNDEIVAAVVQILVGEGGALNNYFTNTQTLSEINLALNNYYTKSQVDNKFPDVPNFKDDYSDVKSRLGLSEISNGEFHSIKILSANVISENQLSGFILNSSILPGLYVFRTNTSLFEILNKSSDGVAFRLKYDGKIYQYSVLNNQWNLIDSTDNSVKSINSLTPINGSLELNLTQINETDTVKLNNLFPQANGTINPLGRNTSFDIGQNSISFGDNSAAVGLNSISIGKDSVSVGENSIQLGTAPNANLEDSSFRVWQWKLLDMVSGFIPKERIQERFFTDEIEITKESWNSSKEYSASLSGITENSIIWLTPSESSLIEYGRSNIRGVSQGLNSILFRADALPNSTVTVKVVWRE
jgi:hypothetical protein